MKKQLKKEKFSFLFIVLKYFIISFMLLKSLTAINDISYGESTKFKVLYLIVDFYKNGSLKNVTTQNFSDFTIEDIRNNIYKLKLNRDYLIKNNSLSPLSKVGLIVWNSSNIPTLLYQVMNIGQKIEITVKGCKKKLGIEKCNTEVRTAKSETNTLIIWSCSHYKISLFKGEPDLDNCVIVKETNDIPFIYGKGNAKKENIKNYLFLEQISGNINHFFNFSKGTGYSFNEFFSKTADILKISKESSSLSQYYYLLGVDVFKKTNEINPIGPKVSLSFDEIQVDTDYYDQLMTDVGNWGLIIGGLAGLTMGVIGGGGLGGAIALAITGGVVTSLMGVTTILLLKTLEACGDEGSDKAYFTGITNYFDYSLVAGSCDSSFCKRATYDTNNNLINNNNFQTAKGYLGSYTFTNEGIEVKNKIKDYLQKIYKGTTCNFLTGEDFEKCEKFKNTTLKLLNEIDKCKTIGEVWALWMAYTKYAKVYNIKDKKYIFWSCNKISNSCVTFNSSNLVSTLNKELKDFNSEGTNYGETTRRGVIDFKRYNSFIMIANITRVPIIEFLTNLTYHKGQVMAKTGTDSNGPYLTDSKGNKIYLLEKVEVGNRTYYLPSLLLIDEPAVTEISAIN